MLASVLGVRVAPIQLDAAPASARRGQAHRCPHGTTSTMILATPRRYAAAFIARTQRESPSGPTPSSCPSSIPDLEPLPGLLRRFDHTTARPRQFRHRQTESRTAQADTVSSRLRRTPSAARPQATSHAAHESKHSLSHHRLATPGPHRRRTQQRSPSPPPGGRAAPPLTQPRPRHEPVPPKNRTNAPPNSCGSPVLGRAEDHALRHPHRPGDLRCRRRNQRHYFGPRAVKRSHLRSHWPRYETVFFTRPDNVGPRRTRIPCRPSGPSASLPVWTIPTTNGLKRRTKTN